MIPRVLARCSAVLPRRGLISSPPVARCTAWVTRQSVRSYASTQTPEEDPSIDRVKKLWESRFGGAAGRDEWQAMPEEEQRKWFEGQLMRPDSEGDTSGPEVDVEAEWQVSAQSSKPPGC